LAARRSARDTHLDVVVAGRKPCHAADGVALHMTCRDVAQSRQPPRIESAHVGSDATTAHNSCVALADFAFSESPRYVGRAVVALASGDGTSTRSAPVNSPPNTALPTSTAHSPTSGDTSRRSASRDSTPTPTIKEEESVQTGHHDTGGGR